MSTLLYHITHLENLPSIVQSGGIWCDRERRQQGFKHQNIAHEHIKSRRSHRKVPTPQDGVLADYVPFYFAPRSPMLYTINQGNVRPDLKGQQDSIIHMVTSVGTMIKSGRPCCFTDRHADLTYAKFFDDMNLLRTEICWDAMTARYWSDKKEQRQAEFLVHHHVLWTEIEHIGVMSESTLLAVRQLIGESKDVPSVIIQPDWYY